MREHTCFTMLCMVTCVALDQGVVAKALPMNVVPLGTTCSTFAAHCVSGPMSF